MSLSSEDNRRLTTLLNGLSGKTWSDFQDPVTDDRAPFYSLLIEKPICLTDMKKKLGAGAYGSVSEFKADMDLMFDNCHRYNTSDDPITQSVVQRALTAQTYFLSRFFEQWPHLRQNSNHMAPDHTAAGYCTECRTDEYEHLLLLCSGGEGQCQHALHTYCGGLRTVPKGDWFCPQCRNVQQHMDVDAPAPPSLETGGPANPSASAAAASASDSGAAAGDEKTRHTQKGKKRKGGGDKNENKEPHEDRGRLNHLKPVLDDDVDAVSDVSHSLQKLSFTAESLVPFGRVYRSTDGFEYRCLLIDGSLSKSQHLQLVELPSSRPDAHAATCYKVASCRVDTNGVPSFDDRISIEAFSTFDEALDSFAVTWASHTGLAWTDETPKTRIHVGLRGVVCVFPSEIVPDVPMPASSSSAHA
ncbi:unnamed protein product [Vitrella brassicaformis CCMP3155]|uniref:PHD-type domain-containing protein n=2 Tax=Vitrella brassicaformis TaxID=1169539 RepID=A0A0G4GS18_VITBC|nr:unnamed protein product [Vitrella brassicaformis CCMP3155]|eukprot:CEM33407.1 unnamed protein product [Vitrella brassicaformis CCMP3155]